MRTESRSWIELLRRPYSTRAILLTCRVFNKTIRNGWWNCRLFIYFQMKQESPLLRKCTYANILNDLNKARSKCEKLQSRGQLRINYYFYNKYGFLIKNGKEIKKVAPWDLINFLNKFSNKHRSSIAVIRENLIVNEDWFFLNSENNL